MGALNKFLGIVALSVVLYIVLRSQEAGQNIRALASGTSSIIGALQGRDTLAVG